jgi:D-aspartate ligase
MAVRFSEVRRAARAVGPRPRGGEQPFAVVMGGIDVVRPLALAGVPCAVFARPRDSVHFSRYARVAIPRPDPRVEPAAAVDRLLEFASMQPEPPVLLPTTDEDLILVSRARERLAASCHFVLPTAELIEDLGDKARFQALAARTGLPVPRGMPIGPDTTPGDVALRYPIIVKPTSHVESGERWSIPGKAVRAETPTDLAEIRAHLRDAGVQAFAQEHISGGEDRVESYHVYVTRDGRIAGEFTGRKIRTVPPQYGGSTAVTITDQPDLRGLGRDIIDRIGLIGVAKLDLKRGPDGALHLLEINARYQLWHHPGALAGVNLPAIGYADALGRATGPPPQARPGVVWSHPLHDARAVRAQGRSALVALAFFARADARSGLALDDPMPFLRGTIGEFVRDRVSPWLRARRSA